MRSGRFDSRRVSVERRYSDFSCFHHKLQQEFRDELEDLVLPPKRLSGNFCPSRHRRATRGAPGVFGRSEPRQLRATLPAVPHVLHGAGAEACPRAAAGGAVRGGAAAAAGGVSDGGEAVAMAKRHPRRPHPLRPRRLSPGPGRNRSKRTLRLCGLCLRSDATD